MYKDKLVVDEITFPGSSSPSQICKFRKYIKTELANGEYNFAQYGDIVYCSWDQFVAFRGEAIAYSSLFQKTDAKYTGGIVDPQCEQLTKMPLIADGDQKGQLDINAIISKRENDFISIIIGRFEENVSLPYPDSCTDRS